MTSSRIEVEELISVLEYIRKKNYPDIPAGLIRAIVENEYEKQDNRARGQKGTRKLIDDFIKKIN